MSDTTTADGKTEDIDLVTIEIDDADADEAARKTLEPGAADADPRRPPDDDADDDGDDDEDDGDERLADGREESNSERMTKRQRAKERRRHAIERRTRELAELRAELTAARLSGVKLEVQFAAQRAQQEAAQIDQRANALQGEYQRLQRQKADAISKNAGAAATQADYRLREIETEYERLRSAKSRVSQDLTGLGQRMQEIAAYEHAAAAPREPEPQAPAISDEGQRHAQDFLAAIPWYKRGAKTGDARAVETIDAVLMAEGFDPNSKQYWDEFRDRLRLALPHRFNAKNAMPPVGGARDTRSTGKRTVTLPRVAIEQMRMAGYIDDNNKVVNREKYLAYVKRYAQNQRAQRSA